LGLQFSESQKEFKIFLLLLPDITLFPEKPQNNMHMKRLLISGIIFAMAVLVSACGNAGKQEDAKVVSTKLSNEESLEAEIKAVEETIAKSDQVASSLRYTKENGASIVVLAHVDDAGKILKIEEVFNDGDNGNNGTISYYMQGKFPFATREYFEDRTSAETPKFVERKSYYDKAGKVLRTIEKRVNYEEELDAAAFVPVALHNCPLTRAQKVLDQKDEFETTFQGFVNVEVLNYLVVGEPKANGYTSAMRADYEDDFIKDALKNEKKYMNRKIRVSFETVQDPSGFEYQMYHGAEWVE